jgi:hypothetical protein
MTSKFSTTILQTYLADKLEKNRYNVYSKVDNSIFYTVVKIKFTSINDGIIDLDILVDDSNPIENHHKYLNHLYLMKNPFFIQVNDNIRKILESNLRIIIDLLDEIDILLKSNTQHKIGPKEINDIISDLPTMMYNKFYNYANKQNVKEIIMNNIKIHINNNNINEQKNEDNNVFIEMLNKLNETSSRQMVNLYANKIKEILDKYNDDYYINLLDITLNDDKREYFKKYIDNESSDLSESDD